ncbi:YeeE/YedE family protein [Schnuerera sp. xch1]|uniref:YeeE/YedE family protein n=1 Tax=Schnuerera sp. xch1 TaxID=2874283 RepID=UPI0021D8F6B5|nr:YeeE/YedE family protein [Schnuerera sp. xch1]MBZ2175021.1 YeeE/YedE family protein [Schnuerera sp. xch1]
MSNNINKIKNQIPIGIFVFIFIIAFSVFLYSMSSTLSFFWITGIVFGFILQRSRFCFASSIRDPYLIGSTSLTKAVLIALAITTVGFTSIKYGAYINGQTIPGQDSISPVSFATIIGGTLFGIGMVLAGGCASGVLMRTGEGFQTQMVALIFFIIGSLWGAHDFGWWHEKFISHANPIFLPDIFGWLGALTIQLLFIAFLFIIADKWESKKSGDY